MQRSWFKIERNSVHHNWMPRDFEYNSLLDRGTYFYGLGRRKKAYCG